MDKIKNMTELLARIGLPIGAAAIWLYAMRINYFPKGLTIGDSISLLMLATVISICILAYMLIIIMGISSAIDIIQTILNLKYKQKSPPNTIKSLLLDTISTIGTLSTPIIIFHTSVSAYTTSIMCGLYLIITFSNQFRYAKYKFYYTPSDPPFIKKNLIQDKSRKLLILIGLMIIVFLLSVAPKSTAFFDLLKFGTSIINLRNENATIYTKKPFSDIVKIHKKSTRELLEYSEFNNVKILFSGIGSITVISLDGSDSGESLQIPNESIIIKTNQQKKP